MNRRVFNALLVCAGALVWSSQSFAEVIDLKDLPKAVSDAIKARYPSAKITEAEKDKEDDVVVFYVQLKQKGPNLDVTVTEAGKITHVQKEIDIKELPKPVTKAVNDKYPKGKLEMAGEVFSVKDGKDVFDWYDVIVKAADKKVWQVEVSKEGKILKTEEIKE